MVSLAQYTERSQPLIINVWLCRDGRVRVGSAAAAKAASGRGSAVCACSGEVGDMSREDMPVWVSVVLVRLQGFQTGSGSEVIIVFARGHMSALGLLSYLGRMPGTKPGRAGHPAKGFGVMPCMRFRCMFERVSVLVGGVAFEENGLCLLSFFGGKGRRTWQCCSRWAVFRFAACWDQ